MQLTPDIRCLSFISECDERWSSHRREAAGASLLTRRLYRPPPHPTEHARRRPGLSRQGTCGCHLTGEKQVEMKGSSRFCQSTSGLLSITAPTSGGVCARVYQTAVGSSVCKNVHIKSLTHRECMCAYARSSMQGV